MTCPKDGKEMTFISVEEGSRYPMGHWVCECGLEISKK